MLVYKYTVKKLKDGENRKVSDKLKFGEYPALSLKEAREKRDETRKILDAGLDPKFQKTLRENETSRQSITFNDAVHEWRKDWRQNKSKNTRKNHNRQFKSLRDIFGEKPLITIDKQTIRKLWNYC